MGMTFKEFMAENLWGNIPVQGKKPSDGRGNNSLSSNTPAATASPMMSQPKMMRKKMRKI